MQPRVDAARNTKRAGIRETEIREGGRGETCKEGKAHI